MSQIDELFDRLDGFRSMPVRDWQPETALDIDLRIDHRCNWYYRESSIERDRLVKLFSSILRLDPDGQFFLVTPHVMYPLTVDCTPFLAVELNVQGSGNHRRLAFRTNVDDVVTASGEHPIRSIDCGNDRLPCIEVRDGLMARLTRSVYYELANYAEEYPGSQSSPGIGVYSGGEFFPLGLD